ncbi:unnamed protein product [Notodromas monacha]|uniref:Sodium/nucleoside cotransporter n=1 Tax=Notodromas monacha TaxID=399045 RepID=A0A7R9BQL4_9CRUS|nr:unnamed protein product [Notodromas monacha]CAG0919828.1 unnamed protein product [Notodromas monacha]
MPTDMEGGRVQSTGKMMQPEEDDDEEEDDNDDGCLSRTMDAIYSRIGTFVEENSGVLRIGALILLFAGYNAYLGAVIWRTVDEGDPIQWCDGSGFLFALTGVVYFCLIYFQIVKRFFGKALAENVITPIVKGIDYAFSFRASKLIAFVAFFAIVLGFIIYDTWDAPRRLQSGIGIIVIVLFAFVFSRHPGKVVWRHVVWGLGLQFIFALMVLRWDFGRNVLECLSDKVKRFLEQANAGSAFVYGYLVNGVVSVRNVTAADGSPIPGFGSGGMTVLSVIFFFSFVIQMLYYYGVMQWLVAKIGWVLQITIGTTAAESLSASANIFVGQTEAPLMVKPYLPIMTKSELHAIMTGGFATVAGTVLAAYISFGISASHILAASVMSAPAALAIAKLFYPETEKSKTTADTVGEISLDDHANVLDAAASGASQAVDLVMNIIANLIAFTSFIAFLDALVAWFALQLGYDYVNFTWIIGRICMPLAWTMGVEWEDCDEVGELIGIKTIVNEFVAYSRLSEFGDTIQPRSKLISTYALCGFSNIAGIGIQLGGLSALAPNRKSDLSEIALRALISGSLACFLTACIAGILIDA